MENGLVIILPSSTSLNNLGVSASIDIDDEFISHGQSQKLDLEDYSPVQGIVASPDFRRHFPVDTNP